MVNFEDMDIYVHDHNLFVDVHNVSYFVQFKTCARLKHILAVEPARAEPNRFLVYRLNHSATVID